jgi:hypothetical protein
LVCDIGSIDQQRTLVFILSIGVVPSPSVGRDAVRRRIGAQHGDHGPGLGGAVGAVTPEQRL